MKHIPAVFLRTFFRKELSLRVKLFHLLALVGVVICLAMTILSILTHMTANIFINAGTCVLSLGLLFYSAKTQHYQFCYAASIVSVFFVLFPSMFFSGGGYHSGMPFFFVFAVAYTVYMLDGWSVVIVPLIEIGFYSLLCAYAYYHPEHIHSFQTEQEVLIDLIAGFLTVSIALGATMFAQSRMYQKQQKELEEARKAAETANQAKSAFLANMSHEIRTPIHIILGMNEIIIRESRSENVQKCSEKIDEASKMLLSLVNHVLDVSKIESGKMELLPDTYQTKELIDLLNLVGTTRCEKKHLTFHLEADPELPPVLFGDLSHIKQIAGNLLSNAAKYTETGSVTAALTQRSGSRENEILLCLSIKDTGVGIQEENIPSLFEAFTRADLASHRHIEGTGLGLAIVKALIDLMHGTIHVSSTYGVGSTFSVSLPQIVVPPEELESSRPKETFIAPLGRILVVDDNIGNRMVLQALLASTQLQVDMAESGAACLKMVQDHDYHLILMDYMMPEISGLETFQKLKQLPGFSVPVVVLTANALSDVEEHLLRAGFSAFLTKPVPWIKLQEILLRFLPPELVTIVPVENEIHMSRQNYNQLKDQLEPYGILLDQAMDYFHCDWKMCRDTAELFLRYNTSEQDKVEALYQSEDFKGLRFILHALKGKAKNMGMERLSEVAARIETLCTASDPQEAKSLIPYFLYLWKKSSEGLSLLSQELDRVLGKSPEDVPDGPVLTLEECRNAMPLLLRQLRRKPSLDCLSVLIDAEPSETGRILLEKTKQSVQSIAFDQAEVLWHDYIERRERTCL